MYIVLPFTFPLLFSLEERQRAEKRNREAKGHKFTPRWFDFTEEVTPTPWGDLEVYQYNGKYTEHRAAVDSSGDIDKDDHASIEFNPWQYGNLSAEWGNPVFRFACGIMQLIGYFGLIWKLVSFDVCIVSLFGNFIGWSSKFTSLLWLHGWQLWMMKIDSCSQPQLVCTKGFFRWIAS